MSIGLTPGLRERIAKRRKQVYLAVKNHRHDLYEGAVRVGEMAIINYGVSVEAAAEIECAAMDLVATALGIDIGHTGDASRE